MRFSWDGILMIIELNEQKKRILFEDPEKIY